MTQAFSKRISAVDDALAERAQANFNIPYIQLLPGKTRAENLTAQGMTPEDYERRCRDNTIRTIIYVDSIDSTGGGNWLPKELTFLLGDSEQTAVKMAVAVTKLEAGHLHNQQLTSTGKRHLFAEYCKINNPSKADYEKNLTSIEES